MKRYALAIITIMCATLAYAQGARIGVTAGLSTNTLHFNQKIIGVESSMGFTVGAKGEFNIQGIGFGLESGLFYEMRGAKLNMAPFTVWNTDGYGREHLFLHTLNVPIHLRYMYQRMNGFEHKLAPFVFAGPQFSFNVGHNLRNAFNTSGVAVSMEFGIGARLFDHWQVAAIYDWGLTYAARTKLLDDYSARNRAWKLQLTYFFGE